LPGRRAGQQFGTRTRQPGELIAKFSTGRTTSE
jgi:hypothetical protein